MSSGEAFPYGNDLTAPDYWAGFGNTKSKSWLVGYDAGWSLGVGAHTCLFFGCENLVAFSATLYGVGKTVSWGASNIAKKLPRGINTSRTSGPGSLSDALKRIEDTKSRTDAVDWAQSVDGQGSAMEIYQKLQSQTNSLEALVPFCYNDLEWNAGAIAGVSADVIIAGSTYYLINADNIFRDVNVFNIKREATLLSAGAGFMRGVWSVGKLHSLWGELAHSDTKEYPFSDLNVHQFFRNWKSPKFASAQASRLYEKRNEILRPIRDDILKNPTKYGVESEFEALNKVVRMDKEYNENLGSFENNPYKGWIKFSDQHLFVDEK